MKVPDKEKSIEALRGLAIIAVVMAHVIADRGTRGLMVEEYSFWRYLYRSFEFLRIPIFTAVSGYVYALSPIKQGRYASFIKDKGRRILLPLFFVASLQYIVNYIVADVNQNVELGKIWQIYLYSYSQFWFLHAIFIVFITILLLEMYQVTTKFKGWLISTILATTVHLILHNFIHTTLFGFFFYLYLLPYFLLGLGLYRFSEILFNIKILSAVTTVMIAGLIVQQLDLFRIIEVPSSRYGLLGTIVGLSGSWFIFYIRKPNRFLAFIGHFSYSIFLFHIFGTAGSRIFLHRLGIEQSYIVFFVGIISGVGVPILIQWLLMKSKVLSLLFLGVKYIPSEAKFQKLSKSTV